MIKIVSTELFPERISEKFNEVPEFDLQFIEPKELENVFEAEALITDKFSPAEKIIRQNKNLKIIIKTGKMFSESEKAVLKKYRIQDFYIPAAKSQAIAEYVLTAILFFSRELIQVLNKERKICGSEISDKIIGIIGFGETGMATAELMKKMKLKVLYYDRNKKNVDPAFVFASKNEIFSQADFISLHLPETTETAEIISAAEFQQIKKPVIIINTSSAKLFNFNDLQQALQNQRIKAVLFDIAERKELPEKILKDKNVYTTPLIASHTTQSRERSGLEALNLLKDFFNV